MIEERQAESDIIQLAARQLEAEGYAVVREPAPATLPPTLRHLHLDAIAVGKRPLLVIEVAREGGASAERVEAIRRALANEADWKLHLILDRSDSQDRLQPEMLEAISSAIEAARSVSEVDDRAALLMSWAAFEAIARHFEPTTFARAQSPGRVVEMLASKGYLVPSEADVMRRLAQRRNKLIHGQLGMRKDIVELDDMFSILDSLVATRRNQLDRR